MQTKKDLKLSAPWDIFWNKMRAMFGSDPEIDMTYDRLDLTICMRVDNEKKAKALASLIPTEKKFGDVVLKIKVIPANAAIRDEGDVFMDALTGNPAFKFVRQTHDDIAMYSATYVVFAKEVVQYYNDSLSDLFGMESTLYQNIAKDIFVEDVGVNFCTDID